MGSKNTGAPQAKTATGGAGLTPQPTAAQPPQFYDNPYTASNPYGGGPETNPVQPGPLREVNPMPNPQNFMLDLAQNAMTNFAQSPAQNAPRYKPAGPTQPQPFDPGPLGQVTPDMWRAMNSNPAPSPSWGPGGRTYRR